MTATTAQPIELGMVLSFDESGFEAVKGHARRLLLPAVNDCIKEYQLLGLPDPMTTEILHDLLVRGTGKVKERLEEVTRTDMEGFRSPIALQEALKQVDSYLVQLVLAVERAREALSKTNSTISGQYSIQLSVLDIIVCEGQALVNIERIKPHFTNALDTEVKLEAYRMLQELADKYNETQAFIAQHGFLKERLPLINSFLEPADPTDFNCRRELKVRIKGIPSLK